jgi:glycosyltransferase involved in cell wall biosynthesis
MKTSAWQSVKRSKWYALAREIKWRVETHATQDYQDRYRVLSLAPQGASKGNVLLSRPNRAFLRQPGEALPVTHKNLWEAFVMAQIFLDLGFSVDVIDFTNDSFLPRKDYSLFVDAKWNMERIAPYLNKDCHKVLHIVTTHTLFQNEAELKRLLALQQRRGITLRPRRQDKLNWGIEHADCATVIGNEFTLETYRYANKPLYRVPSAWPVVYPWPETKDFEGCRNRFVWFGGGGMVHKGLDLVLEAFASMPECHLTVCGPVEKEKDFVEAYRRELYETENIHLFGWMDVDSPQFLELADHCAAVVRPSCSEGGSAAVVGGMHAGLIPIISRESSLDVSPEFGILLQTSSIEEIREAVLSIASRPANEVREMARNTWRLARQEHSCGRFVEEYKKVITQILTLPWKEDLSISAESEVSTR